MSSTLKEINVGLFEDNRAFAQRLDRLDPFAATREEFFRPKTANGDEVIYLVGNSLGLQPKTARAMVEEELDDWATLGVRGHTDATRPWLRYHERARDALARLVGAEPREVVAMNTLTTNLHLLLVSFFRPQGDRSAILIEDGAFPSDTYAVETHLASRNLDPKKNLLRIAPREGEVLLRTEDVVAFIDTHASRLATILLGGVNYRTGQLLDMQAITAAAHVHSITVGFDLAHAAGNVLLALHEWNVDFAAWCSYKYLNSGPGAIAGAFIHSRHIEDPSVLRYGGWWGNDPSTRFNMHAETAFIPIASADSWQLSNPPILSLAPLLASLAIFDACGIDALREKSRVLTGYLHFLLRERLPDSSTILTPSNAEERGCQLSLLLHDRPHDRFQTLASHGIEADFREPNIIRLAPTPLYTSFEECWQTAEVLGSL